MGSNTAFGRMSKGTRIKFEMDEEVQGSIFISTTCMNAGRSGLSWTRRDSGRYIITYSIF